jgi:hypothetical protein
MHTTSAERTALRRDDLEHDHRHEGGDGHRGRRQGMRQQPAYPQPDPGAREHREHADHDDRQPAEGEEAAVEDDLNGADGEDQQIAQHQQATQRGGEFRGPVPAGTRHRGQEFDHAGPAVTHALDDPCADRDRPQEHQQEPAPFRGEHPVLVPGERCPRPRPGERIQESERDDQDRERRPRGDGTADFGPQDARVHQFPLPGSCPSSAE